MNASNGAGAAMAVSAIEKSRSHARRKGNRWAIVQQRMDALAEHVANGGAFPALAVAAGIDKSRVYQLWSMICGDLGAQAS